MDRIHFEERAPRPRTEREFIIRVLAATLGFLLVSEMVAVLLGIAPVALSRFFEGKEAAFFALLVFFIAVAVILGLRLLPPMRGKVEVRISPEDDKLVVLHGRNEVGAAKLSEVTGVRIGPYPVPDGLISDWVKPTGIWAIDSFVRKNELARSVYLLTGDENNKEQIEVAAFLARGDEGERLAQQAAKEIEEALEKARPT